MPVAEIGRLVPLFKLTPVTDKIAAGEFGYARVRLRRTDSSRKQSHVLEGFSQQARVWVTLDDRISREYRRDCKTPYVSARIGMLPVLIEVTGEYELTAWVGRYKKLPWHEADALDELKEGTSRPAAR